MAQATTLKEQPKTAADEGPVYERPMAPPPEPPQPLPEPTSRLTGEEIQERPWADDANALILFQIQQVGISGDNEPRAPFNRCRDVLVSVRIFARADDVRLAHEILMLA